MMLVSLQVSLSIGECFLSLVSCKVSTKNWNEIGQIGSASICSVILKVTCYIILIYCTANALCTLQGVLLRQVGSLQVWMCFNI
jgi:hypothetical protein